MEIDWELLERYLAGECLPEERERFEAWLAESPAHRQVVQELREVVAQSRQAVVPEREEQLLAELKQKLQPAPPSLRVLRTLSLSTPSRSRWSSAMKAAAVAALLVAGAVGAYVVHSATPRPRAAIATSDLARRVVTTPRGQRVAFNLPDGTRVMLGAASTLEYPAVFGASRDVRLRGEAYFEVEHNARRPFVVRAGDLVATDLGTEFVVRAYPEDRDHRVVVRQGKVGLRAAGSGAGAERILQPGQLGRLGPGGESIVEWVDVDAQFAWTEGRLVFDGTPLSEVAVELGRWFDVRFQFTDPALASLSLYASFRNQSLTSVLDEIAPTLRLRYERRDSVIVVRPLESSR